MLLTRSIVFDVVIKSFFFSVIRIDRRACNLYSNIVKL